MPRHPPSALTNLTTHNKPQKTKMLASTMQFSTHNQPTTHPETPAPRHRRHRHHPNRYAPQVMPGTETTTTPHRGTRRHRAADPPGRPGCSLRTQQGAQHPPRPPPPAPFRTPGTPPRGHPPGRVPDPAGHQPTTDSPVSPPTSTPPPPPGWHGPHPTAPRWMALLRKEVIQPHLPVRLPCYDFVPIASPTFDHSPRTRSG